MLVFSFLSIPNVCVNGYILVIPAACRAVSAQWVQKSFSPATVPLSRISSSVKIAATNLHTLTNNNSLVLSTNPAIINLSNNPQYQQTRNVTKFSLQKGKRKSVKAALKRFMRLEWGGWIRTRAGRHKRLWKKSGALRNRLKQHVLVNSTQAWLLDKMVTKYWRRPKHYIDDPYRPYHKRENYYATRKDPIQY